MLQPSGDGLPHSRFFYRGFFRRRSPIILVFLVATLAGALFSNAAFPQTYLSTSLLSFRNLRMPSFNWYFAQANVHYARTFSKLVSSPGFLIHAADEAGVHRSYAELQKAVAVTAITDTELLEVKVRDRDPVVAYRLNRAILDVLSNEWTQEIHAAIPPEIPDAPAGQQTLLNIAFAVLVGLLAAFATLVLVEYVDGSLKTVAELGGLGYGDPVMVRDPYLADSLLEVDGLRPSEQELEPFYRIRNRIIERPVEGEHDGCKVVLACGLAPGVGATSIAAVLGIMLARAGFRTLVVDADFERARLSFLLGGEGSGEGLADLLQSPGPGHHVQATAVPGLGLLIAGKGEENLRTAAELCTPRLVGNALKILEADWDFILVGGLSLAWESRLEAFLPVANHVVLAVRLFADEVQATRRFRRVAKRVRASAVVIQA